MISLISLAVNVEGNSIFSNGVFELILINLYFEVYEE